jgi:catechol 2,3-dioxygenase-like lactoylglutathione lyase family enzyme
MTLATVMVFVKDVTRMRAFYRDVLGLSIVENLPGWVKFDAGGAGFALYAIPAAYAASIEITDPPRTRSETPIKYAFRVRDLAAARARVVEAHGQAGDPRTSGGGSSCDCIDPEGNVFQLVEGP